MTRPAVDALVVLQRSDVAHLLAERQRFEGLKLVFFDPGLLDEALSNGLPGADFRHLDLEPDLQARAVACALARATDIDQRLAALRRELFDGAVFDGWDVGLFNHALLRLFMARGFGDAIERALPGLRLGVLRPDEPQQFYFDSCLVSDLVARDPARWCVFDRYAGARLHDPAAYDQVFDAQAVAAELAARPVGVVAHVPTCFYDARRIASEIARIADHWLDLPSRVWDVPLRPQRVPLRPLAALPILDPACERYAARAAQVLGDALADWLPNPASRALQLDSWSRRCRMQAVNYMSLRAAMRGHAPDFVVTDHDAGHNGPLFSLAATLGSRVFVLPHSAHPAMVLPHARRVTAIERAGYGTPARTVLGQRVPVRPVRWPAAPAPARADRVARLCLLLNTAHTEGLSYNDLFALRAFHGPLAELCRREGVELVVRLKPGTPALRLMSGTLSMAPEALLQTLAQPLDEVARATQLCIAFGEPSTGVLTFLDAGASVVNACPVDWPVDLVACPPLVADGVVPSLALNEALREVQRQIVDPSYWRAARDRQADSLRRRAAGAHEHLFPDPSPGA